MRKISKIFLLTALCTGLVCSERLNSQEINIKIGERDSIQSGILNETRHILVHLPDNYNQSKSYPVLYRLDGSNELLLETMVIVNRLVYSDELAPEMIIVAVENTMRSRDMWPVNNDYYPQPNKPGAEDFLKFMEKELIPHIERNYSTDNSRILCGQSLSAIFVVYSFLTKPYLFDSYLASSAGFPACEDYFTELSNRAFQQLHNYHGQKVFITDGLLDPLDPDRVIHQQLRDFTNLVNDKLGTRVYYRHVTYENEGHVPFHSLYDGLRFIFGSGKW